MDKSAYVDFIRRIRAIAPRFLISAIFIILTVSCNFSAPDEKDGTKNNETEVALSVEETLSSKEIENANATIAAQQATIQAQGQQPPAQVPPNPPQQTQPAAVQTQAPVAVQPPANPPSGNFSEQMKNAKILLFEDVVSDPSKSRYIKETLDNMGIRYKDEGNAIGWLKNDLLSGSPSGGPWDLAIIAIEERGNVSGEYFEYIQDVLDAGTSVILEAWHLDAISQGKVGPVLTKCGVQVYPYYPKSGDLTDVVLYPYPAAAQHPIMNDPNKGLNFSKTQFTWLFSGDLGSLMAYTGKGDAIFLLGRSSNSDVKDAALAVCLNGQLILQTFSSHSFSYNTLYPLWENMITNALKVRFSGG